MEINIKKFNSNIILLNIVTNEGLNYQYLFFWGEHGTLFIIYELWDDKTTGCNFLKARWVFTMEIPHMSFHCVQTSFTRKGHKHFLFA